MIQPVTMTVETGVAVIRVDNPPVNALSHRSVARGTGRPPTTSVSPIQRRIARPRDARAGPDRSSARSSRSRTQSEFTVGSAHASVHDHGESRFSTDGRCLIGHDAQLQPHDLRSENDRISDESRCFTSRPEHLHDVNRYIDAVSYT